MPNEPERIYRGRPVVTRMVEVGFPDGATLGEIYRRADDSFIDASGLPPRLEQAERQVV
ncbi:MAG: hypothetical protein ACYCOU_24975 [Sulfobacillus sp.]